MLANVTGDSRAGAPGTVIKVLVVELDGGAARTTLRASPDMDVLAADSFQKATALLPTAKVQAVVVALGPPSDPAALKELVTAAGVTPVMVLSQPAEEEPVTQLLKTGISGYLFMQDARFLATGVRELVRGGLPMSPPVSRLVLQRARRSSSTMAAVKPQTAAAQNLLSSRQREILGLLQQGHSYEDIGTALDLSVNTVRSHLRIIYERLGAASKVEAVMIGMELGLLERARLA
ncbi:MAG: response regulator transcription factor [Myxococcales bacterium]|nr:MAG: response regulator transcription factor [Myxococcales bacterium]